jgi:hypothetical protein
MKFFWFLNLFPECTRNYSMNKNAAKIDYKNIESLKEANEIIAKNWRKVETKSPQEIMEWIEINKKLLENLEY